MSHTADADRDHLHSLGYAQELKRGLGTFSNFAISFSIISILAGGFTSYWIGTTFGGPLVITLGWLIVGLMALFVGMSMGEICSAYPTAGGLYFWSAKLARNNGALWSWFTGWFNFVGQIGVIASVDYALANYVVAFLNLYAKHAENPIITPTAKNLFIVYLVVLATHGLLNTFGVKLVRLLGDVSVWWHVIGVAVIFVILAAGPDTHQNLSYLFKYQNNSSWSGGISTLYVFFLGFLLAQYTITGFDASAHVSEETKGARTGAPKAIVRSIYISAIAALVMNVAFLLATPKSLKPGDLLNAGITAPVIIFQAVLGTFNTKLLVLITVVGQYFCGMASVTANSRMIYAFSRDGGLPLSNVWHKINAKTRTPTNAVWLGVIASAVTGALSLLQHKGVSTAFFALTGICVVGLYISYVIPIFLRLRNPDFEQGPWNLKGYSKLIGWTSIVWVIFISILFFSPLFPQWKWWDSEQVNTANFAGPLILLAFIVVGVWWAISARNWFTGPKVQGTKEELMAIEHELDALEHGGVPKGMESVAVEHHHEHHSE
jgi:amino acid transporter